MDEGTPYRPNFVPRAGTKQGRRVLNPYFRKALSSGPSSDGGLDRIHSVARDQGFSYHDARCVNTGPIQQRAPVENGGAVVRSYWLTGASSTAPAGLSFAPDRAAGLTASRLVCRVRALASWSR